MFAAKVAYLSNQLPTTLDDLIPPNWIPSLRHLSWPPKREKLVQRTSPSLVRRTVPIHVTPDCQLSSHSTTWYTISSSQQQVPFTVTSPLRSELAFSSQLESKEREKPSK